MTNSAVRFGGVFHCEVRDAQGKLRDAFDIHNLVPDTGLNYLLNAGFGLSGASANWYLGLLGNITPAANTTMASIAPTYEVTSYDGGVRITYTPNGVTSTQSITNSSSPAVFTMSADSVTCYGVFLTSSATQGGTSGTLLAAALFSSPKTLDTDETLTVTYALGAADDAV